MDFITTRDNGVTILGDQLSGVFHLLAEKADAVFSLNRAMVRDFPREAKILNIIQKFGIGNLTCCRHEDICTDHRVRPEGDTRWVHEIDLPICSQASVQQGRVRPGNAVENRGLTIWLDELHRAARWDVKVRIIDNRLLSLLINHRAVGVQPSKINLTGHYRRCWVDGIGHERNQGRGKER